MRLKRNKLWVVIVVPIFLLFLFANISPDSSLKGVVWGTLGIVGFASIFWVFGFLYNIKDDEEWEQVARRQGLSVEELDELCG